MHSDLGAAVENVRKDAAQLSLSGQGSGLGANSGMWGSSWLSYVGDSAVGAATCVLHLPPVEGLQVNDSERIAAVAHSAAHQEKSDE